MGKMQSFGVLREALLCYCVTVRIVNDVLYGINAFAHSANITGASSDMLLLIY